MIYVDSSIIVRMIEGSAPVRLPIEERLKQLAPSERVLATSRISLLECRCKPLRDQDAKLLALYDQLFHAGEMHVQEIDAAVVDTATEIRPYNGLKTPDSIHAATATLLRVAAFWTTDRRLSRCPRNNV